MDEAGTKVKKTLQQNSSKALLFFAEHLEDENLPIFFERLGFHYEKQLPKN